MGAGHAKPPKNQPPGSPVDDKKEHSKNVNDDLILDDCGIERYLQDRTEGFGNLIILIMSIVMILQYPVVGLIKDNFMIGLSLFFFIAGFYFFGFSLSGNNSGSIGTYWKSRKRKEINDLAKDIRRVIREWENDRRDLRKSEKLRGIGNDEQLDFIFNQTKKKLIKRKDHIEVLCQSWAKLKEIEPGTEKVLSRLSEQEESPLIVEIADELLDHARTSSAKTELESTT